ncbi:MAG: hypothetical protein Q8L55_13610, partial [Phycisphaerales bacterium]|nr:hypothetical protein [Phycisphaerales bacterium]
WPVLEWIARLIGGGEGALDPSSPAVRFEFAYALAPWHWAVIIAAAAALGWWSYARLEGATWVRVLTGVTRAAILALLVVLVCGPRLIEVRENVERDWVLVLVDRSASMAIADAPAGGAVAAGVLRTRDEQLRAVLQKASPVFAEMAVNRTVKWLGFDASAFDLPVGSGLPQLERPTGQRTDIAAAIEGALAKGAARPIAGIVLLSDGRSALDVPRAVVKRLTSEKVPIVVVPLGSAEGLTDVAIGAIDAPPAAFVNDPVPVRATIARTGTRLPGPAVARLLDRDSGEVLDEQRVEWAEGQTSKALTLTGGAAGSGDRASWEVRVEAVDGSKDLIEANNKADVGFALVNRPLRLLYVDGYPRWEYRFLKNIFSRDESVNFSALLLSAGRKYLQEGSEEIDSLPDSASAWDAIDVIMIGDVQPGVIGAAQLEQIRNRVAVGGAGLLWVAGPSAVPSAYRATPLADLLPVSLAGLAGGGSDAVALWDRDVVLRPAPLAEGLGVLRLGERQPDGSYWPPQVSDPAAGWSRLRWMQRLEPGTLKPAAEALAMAAPADGIGAPTPAVVTMRFGAGRVVYVATDEVWRFRYGRGEDLPERFYMQLIRLLGRESVARSGKPAVLTLTPKDAEVGSPVRVGVDLIDQSLLDARPTGLTVRLSKATATGEVERVEVEVVLKPTGDAGGGRARSFVGTWVPQSAGTWSGVVTDAILEGKGVSAAAEVALRDDELRRPEADHPLLTALAQETGGTVLNEATIDRLSAVLPKREVRTLSVARLETLWDRPAVLMILLGLLTIEWVLRRVIRLI